MKRPGEDDFDQMPAGEFIGPAKPAGKRWDNPQQMEAFLAAGGELTTKAPLLRAYPHQFGPGKIHLMDPERAQTTLCGKALAFCPGEQFPGEINQITCGSCQQTLVNHAQHHQRQQQWEKERRERNEEFEQKRQQWRAAYADYLRSPFWQHRRQLVFARAARYGTTRDGQPLCEGCREYGAREVHHICYPPDCLPGSQQWLDQEMIYQLVALCHDCHQKMLGIRYIYYG